MIVIQDYLEALCQFYFQKEFQFVDRSHQETLFDLWYYIAEQEVRKPIPPTITQFMAKYKLRMLLNPIEYLK